MIPGMNVSAAEKGIVESFAGSLFALAIQFVFSARRLLLGSCQQCAMTVAIKIFELAVVDLVCLETEPRILYLCQRRDHANGRFGKCIQSFAEGREIPMEKDRLDRVVTVHFDKPLPPTADADEVRPAVAELMK
jgi:hypothetical protein